MGSAPLEARDPERAKALKRKALRRLADMGRQADALDLALEPYAGTDGARTFADAFGSPDLTALNSVRDVERGVEVMFSWVAELSAFGLELAGERIAEDEPNAREDFRRLRELGVLDATTCTRLVRVAGVRNRVVHEYAEVDPEAVYEAANTLREALPGFVGGYQDWVRADFAADT